MNMTEVLTEHPTGVDIEVELHENDFDGWFCIKTDPFPCVCGNFMAHYGTCMHLIMVWPEMDDPTMLSMAAMYQRYNRHPKIIEYKSEYGPCISYYEAMANPKVQPHT